MKIRLARFISVLGHPALVMPLCALITSNRHKDTSILWIAPLLATLCAGIIMIYSIFKTRKGQWAHIDASGKQERSELNSFAMVLLLVIVIGLVYFQAEKGIVLVVGIAAILILVAHLLRQYMKPSMHVAFCLFAACIVWPVYWMVLILGLLGFALGWSRLVLMRHTIIDVIVGAVIGLMCGGALRILMH